MADEQDRAEALDEDAEPMVAPDRPPGVQAYGAAGAEPHADEPVARRAAREEPEVYDAVGDGAVDAGEIDSTLVDFATEREAPPPAEEAALHVVDPLGVADEDPELAAIDADPDVLQIADLPEDETPTDPG